MPDTLQTARRAQGCPGKVVRRGRTLLAALLVVVSAAPPYAADELVLLSPHWEGVRTEFGNAFQQLYRRDTGQDVDLKWLDVGGASDILKYIRSEYRAKPDGIGVDLFFGGGTDPYAELKRLGLLAPFRLSDEELAGFASELNGVPLYDAQDFTWYAATMAGFGIIYNKVVLQRLGLPAPRTWEDLARPELYSWVGSADPRKSGSVHMAYEIILQAYGWERGWQILTAMGGNARGFSANAAQTPKDVALGEVAYGLCIDSYAWAQVRAAGEQRIGFVMPEDLTVVNGDAIAILRGAPNRPVAERFVRFVLSAEGQKLWMLRLGEPDGPRKFELEKFSVRPGLYREVEGRTSIRVNPFEWHSSFVYDSAVGSARWGIVNDLVGAMIIDPHDALTATWRREIRNGDPEAAIQRLGTPVLSEDQVKDLVDRGSWREASFRSQQMAMWSAAARTRYTAPGGGFAQNLPALVGLAAVVAAVVHLRRRRRT